MLLVCTIVSLNKQLNHLRPEQPMHLNEQGACAACASVLVRSLPLSDLRQWQSAFKILHK